jgi:hypothetical protein
MASGGNASLATRGESLDSRPDRLDSYAATVADIRHWLARRSHNLWQM